MSRDHLTRRRLRTALIWLVASACLGSATTVAVACWCAFRGRQAETTIAGVSGSLRRPGYAFWYVRELPHAGCREYRSDWAGSDVFPSAATQTAILNRINTALAPATLPAWAAFLEPSDSDSDGVGSGYALEAGWPLPALAGGELRVITPAGTHHRRQSMIALDSESFAAFNSGGWQRALPTAILPIGFIADSALFASVLLLSPSVPLLVRRYRRSRLGLCPVCGYPRSGGLTCPECGWTQERPNERCS